MIHQTKDLFRRLGRCALLGAALGAVCLACAALLRPYRTPGCRTRDLLDTRALVAVQGGGAAPEETADKVVYLTFDDGPSETTEKVLDTLRDEGVPATFFVMAADNNEKYLPTLERTAAEGHLIAMHTCSHEYKDIYRSADAYWADLDRLREKLLPYVPDGEEIKWIRFPGGSSNTVSHRYGGSGIMRELKAQAAERGLVYVDWNVSAEDAVGGHPSADTIYNNVVREVGKKTSCIVLMHDTNATKNTAAALPEIIRWFRSAGFRFDTVDHLPAPQTENS